MLDDRDIYELYTQRQKDMNDVHAAAALLESVYEGKFEVVLPEIDENEYAGVANLIQTGIDQHAMRVASVQPNIICPPTSSSAAAKKRANQRKLTLQAFWYMNQMPIKMGYRARHLIGMSMSPVIVRPGKDFPIWEVRKPREAFPSPGAPDDFVPHDCIFAFEREAKWVMDNYEVYGLSDMAARRNKDEPIKLLQYLSADQYSLVALGKEAGVGETATMLLSNVENRTGMPCVVIPGRITMSTLQGQFDQLIGMYATQAKLWALQIHAVLREIFGETWVTSTQAGGQPQIVTEADAYEGTVGVVRDGQISQFRANSAQGPLQAIDRQERSQRLTGAIPSEMGGEGATNIRTGRRGSQVFSATVDFYIQEHQNLLAQSLEYENKIAIKIAKTYYGDAPKTYYVPIANGQVSYTPSKTFEIDDHSVTYSYAGTDTNSLVIEGGQRVAMGTLSKTSWMEIDPMVKDANSEHDRIVKESIEQAFLQSILQQASMPDGPWQPIDLGRLMQLVTEEDMELWKAVDTVHQEAQARQQSMAEGGMQGAPAQPGLGMAGAPGTPQAGIQPPNPDQMNLGSLMANAKLTSRPVAR